MLRNIQSSTTIPSWKYTQVSGNAQARNLKGCNQRNALIIKTLELWDGKDPPCLQDCP